MKCNFIGLDITDGKAKAQTVITLEGRSSTNPAAEKRQNYDSDRASEMETWISPPPGPAHFIPQNMPLTKCTLV